MAAYVYRKSDGVLVSWNQGDDDQVAPDEVLKEKGLVCVRGLPELDEAHAWDETKQTVIEQEVVIKSGFNMKSAQIQDFLDYLEGEGHIDNKTRASIEAK